MARLQLVSPEDATGRAKDLLDAVKRKLGLIPNMTRAMANSPATLNAYLQLSGTLGEGILPIKVREQIALAVSEATQCDYCVAAHSAIGRSVGLTAEQIQDSRLGTAVDAKSAALIRFALQVLANGGQVSDDVIDEVRSVGHGDAELAEVVANVALHVFTTSFNRMAETEIDFPPAAPLKPELAKSY